MEYLFRQEEGNEGRGGRREEKGRKKEKEERHRNHPVDPERNLLFFFNLKSINIFMLDFDTNVASKKFANSSAVML